MKKKLTNIVVITLTFLMFFTTVISAEKVENERNGKHYQPFARKIQRVYLVNAPGGEVGTNINRLADLWAWHDPNDTDVDPNTVFNDATWRNEEFNPIFCLDKGTHIGYGNRIFSAPQELLDDLFAVSNKEKEVRYLMKNAIKIMSDTFGKTIDPYKSVQFDGTDEDSINYRVFRTGFQLAMWNLMQGITTYKVADFENGTYDVLNPFDSGFLTGQDALDEIEVLKKIETFYNALIAESLNAKEIDPEFTVNIDDSNASIHNPGGSHYFYGPLKVVQDQSHKTEEAMLVVSNADVDVVDATLGVLPEKLLYGSATVNKPYVYLNNEFYLKIPNSIPSDGIRDVKVTAYVRAVDVICSIPVIFGGEYSDNYQGEPLDDIAHGDMHWKAAQMTIGLFDSVVDLYADDALSIASFTFSGQKFIENNTQIASVANMFTFSVTDSKGNVVATGTNDIDGIIRFSSIIFNKAGTYTFTITEDAIKQGDWKKDYTQYTITINVQEDSSKELFVSGYELPEAITFRNSRIPKTGINDLSYLGFGILLLASFGFIAAETNKRRSVIQ